MSSEISTNEVLDEKAAIVSEQQAEDLSQATDADLTFLEKAHPAVRSHLQAATDLPTFLASVKKLSLNARRKIVDQALLLFTENFVHLPLKEAMHGVDPVQKLRLIQHRLSQVTNQTMGNEFEFHREMIEIFNSVRDLHTNYLLPMPFANKIAFLPFDVEECFVDGEPTYIATHFMEGFSPEHFVPGVTVTTWNGVPIERAVQISAHEHAGSNLAARHAQGIVGLTIRALQRSLPPDALWVMVGYTDLNGKAREFKQPWIINPRLEDVQSATEAEDLAYAAHLGNDIQADIIQKARKMLFAPEAIEKEGLRTVKSGPRELPAEALEKITGKSKGDELETTFTKVLRAKAVKTEDGEFGYIRIFSFNLNDPTAFIDEFVRLIEQLPQDGLIIDVRGNGGGHIYASEGLLQVLTPGEITPEPTQFLNSPLNARLCERHKVNRVGIDLGPWLKSIQSSVETGAVYSRGFPITPHEFANDRGQKYHGPVVLVTDARCYSATDIFAAGFQDHKIGHILGVDGNTGAGGANVWEHGLLQELLRIPAPADTETPYEDLPNGANMRVAIRRTLRVGDQAGTPVEDLGVVPDSIHKLTKADLLEGNPDLIKRAGKILKGMPVRSLTAEVNQNGSQLTVNAKTTNLTRVDIYIDERPATSVDIKNDAASATVECPTGSQILRLAGFDGSEMVAARRIDL